MESGRLRNTNLHKADGSFHTIGGKVLILEFSVSLN